MRLREPSFELLAGFSSRGSLSTILQHREDKQIILRVSFAVQIQFTVLPLYAKHMQGASQKYLAPAENKQDEATCEHRMEYSVQLGMVLTVANYNSARFAQSKSNLFIGLVTRHNPI